EGRRPQDREACGPQDDQVRREEQAEDEGARRLEVSVWAVLAAAGSGERLGADRPKAFVRLGERPLLAESLERLDASEWADQIVETLDRDQLRVVQTPQAFVADILRRGLGGSEPRSHWTDCAAAVEANGGRVKVVEGDPRLMKITDPADLDRVAALL